MKLSIWKRNYFTIESQTFEDACKIIKSWKGDSVLDIIDEKVFFNESELLFDTEKELTVKENGG